MDIASPQSSQEDEELENKKPLLLLDLPAELWVKVCEYAVIQEGCSICINCDPGICAFGCYVTRPCCLMPKQPALSMTCRALRMECLKLFYGRNTFHTRNWGLRNVLDWSLLIGKDNLRNIKALHVATHGKKQELEEGLQASLERGSLYSPLKRAGLQLEVGNLVGLPLLQGTTYSVNISWAEESG